MTDARHKTPAEVSAFRVEVILNLDYDTIDATDPETWTIAKVPLTPWQVRQISRASDREWQQAADLSALDVELCLAALEQTQRPSHPPTCCVL